MDAELAHPPLNGADRSIKSYSNQGQFSLPEKGIFFGSPAQSTIFHCAFNLANKHRLILNGLPFKDSRIVVHLG